MGLVEKLSFQAAAAEASADPTGSSEDCPASGQGFQACIAPNGTVTGEGLSLGRGCKLGKCWVRYTDSPLPEPLKYSDAL